VIGIETFPPAAEGSEPARTFEWGRILARKEELSRTLDADWFIHHDADEFRESPWDAVTLRDGIARVDAAGFNAIDFHVLNFRPTTADPAQAASIRERLQYYEPPGEFDRLQVKCLEENGSARGAHHDRWPQRGVPGTPRVSGSFFAPALPDPQPEPWAPQGVRRTRAAFSPAERAQGWHVQYDNVDRAAVFVRDPAELMRYDPDAVRLDVWIRHRGVEALERDASASREEAKEAKALRGPAGEEEALRRQLAAKTSEFEFLRQAHNRVERALRDLARRTETLDEQVRAAQTAAADAQRERDALTHERHVLARGLEVEQSAVARLQHQIGHTETEWRQLRAEIDSMRAGLAQERDLRNAADATVSSVLASRSWRMTAPLRKLDRKFGKPVPGARDLPFLSLPLGRGLWPDSDVTVSGTTGGPVKTLRCRSWPRGPATQLIIEGRVPAEIPDGQVLSLAAGDETWTFQAPPGQFRWPVPLAVKPNAPFLFVITAARVWQPSDKGASADRRGLAWHVDRIDAG
jgi:hypothetical protein